MSPPRDFQALKTLIIDRKPDLPKRLAQVAVFALDNPDEIAFGTAASIAERSNVQPSTLVRFAQAIGYGGFTDLQAVFRERLRERGSSYEERLDTIVETADRGSAPRAAVRTQLFRRGRGVAWWRFRRGCVE